MVFSSVTFLFYFLPIAIAGYFVFFFSRPVQNIWLLIVSLVFYAWGEPVFVFIMLGSIFINWIFGLLIDGGVKNQIGRKFILILSCIMNIGLLGVYKYTDFIVNTINDVVGKELIKAPGIALQIGRAHV